MKDSYIRDIISTFFENDSSKNTQFLFRKWFRMDENHTEKDQAMEELWENSSSVISVQTLEDLLKIKAKIDEESPAEIIPSYPLYKRLLAYAAVAALIIVSSVFLTYKFAVSPQMEYTQLSVSYGESKRITLSDGSIITLNAGSTLIYPKLFTTNTRSVFLTGEGDFCIAKNPDKPFIVRTKYLDVKAIGTKFIVQSYPNADYTKATLIEGKVKVNMEQDQSKSYILKPNNQLTYSHNNNSISIVNVDAAKLSSWENGYLIFQGVTFDEITSTLERKYNIVFNYDGRKLNQQSYYIKFNPDESIKQVLDVLCMLINKSSYKIEGSNVYFYTN
ncbi:MAG: FecR family protein [Paludibacter sp.]|nr:FecR family protein [Paludibacter sp.]